MVLKKHVRVHRAFSERIPRMPAKNIKEVHIIIQGQGEFLSVDQTSLLYVFIFFFASISMA